MSRSKSIDEAVPVNQYYKTPFGGTPMLRNELDEIFYDLTKPVFVEPLNQLKFIPPFSLKETEKTYIVEMEIPGVDKKNIDVDIADKILTVRGQKESIEREKNANFRKSERTFGWFMRSIHLPFDSDNKATAKIDSGILRIEIAKDVEAKKRKTSILVQ